MRNKEQIQNEIMKAVRTVKETNPMAGSITNTITINFVANAQLAAGGSAAMVYLPDEAEFLVKAGGAFYINMGGILPVYEETLPHGAKILCESGKPWVLDPVAIGIGSLRTKLLMGFKDYKPSVIRGNASEIIALASLWGLTEGEQANTRGVDAMDSVLKAKDSAVVLARFTGGAVAVSGERDLMTDGKMIAMSFGGSPLMEKITGAGCSLGGVTAVYASAAEPFIAALTAAQAYNLAGKRAEEKSQGPGSFQSQFLDELYNASAEDIANNPFQIEEVQV